MTAVLYGLARFCVRRRFVVPALMVLMGKLNWYMPRALDRVVPHLSIEGAEFFAVDDEPGELGTKPVGAGA